MKIVMLCDFFNEALTYQENLLTKFYVKHGHDVTVITSTFDSVFDYVNDRYDRRATARSYFAAGAKIMRFPYRVNFLNRVRIFPRLDETLEDEAPDLIFVHDIMFNFVDAVRYIERHPNTRMIMDYHADYSNSGKNWLSLKILHGVLRKSVLDKARPHLQRIFPVVPAGVSFLNEVYGVPFDEMEVLPLGADLDLSYEVQVAQEGSGLRRRYGIGPDAFVIFTGGKLAPAKRTEVLIESVKRLNRPDTYLVVIGDSSDSDHAYKSMLIEAARHCPRIILTGWLDARQILAHLDMCDIAVFPASQSILWQQAIGMGLPLVLGERMALPGGKQDVSYLNLYDNLILITASAPLVDQLTDVLGNLTADPGLRAKMRQGAVRVAAEVLDWNVIVERTLRFNRPMH